MKQWAWLHRWISPPFLLGKLIVIAPVSGWCASICLVIGLIGGLWIAPPDYLQGEGFRILYVHVPAAILSMSVFLGMALCALIGLVWRVKIAFWIMEASAPIGLSMTTLTLMTGSIWGKPMWGTWWIWDARLTSELILFFLYMGVLGLLNVLSTRKTAHQTVAWLVIVGALDIPIIHFSVIWWNTLHQGSTLKWIGPSHIDGSMLWPLLIMLLAFILFCLWALVLRLQCLIVQYEARTEWLALFFASSHRERIRNLEQSS